MYGSVKKTTKKGDRRKGAKMAGSRLAFDDTKQEKKKMKKEKAKKAKGKAGSWIAHVKAFAKKNNMSYKEALSKAGASYKKK
mgnify:CR=1 FL=1